MSSPTRPRDATASRTAILDAALSVFSEEGFAGARVDEIARRAGYNKSLIFQYFADKQGLYTAVVDRVRDDSDAAFRAAIGIEALLNTALTKQQLHHTLRRSVEWVFDHFLEHPSFIKLFTWEMSNGWQVFRGDDQPLESSFQLGLEMLRRAQKAGLLRDDISPETVICNVLSLPLVTLGAIPRFSSLRGVKGNGIEIEALRGQTVRFVLHAALPDDP